MKSCFDYSRLFTMNTKEYVCVGGENEGGFEDSEKKISDVMNP